MTDLRKAAEMALEALDCLPWQASPIAVEATKALRQALAQPEQEPSKQFHEWACAEHQKIVAESANSTTSVAEPKTLAQPEQYDQTALELCEKCGWKAIIPDDGCLVCAKKNQKPVAWMYVNDDGKCEEIEYIGDFDEHLYLPPAGQWLYTAPPKREWKGLTSDDKHFLLANAWNKEQAFDGFMDAIDKFLEEKNT